MRNPFKNIFGAGELQPVTEVQTNAQKPIEATKEKLSPEEEQRRQQIKKRIAELLPDMIDEVAESVQTKYPAVSVDLVRKIADSAGQHDFSRPGSMTTWSRAFSNEYSKTPGYYNDTKNAKMLWAILGQFSAQIYYILHEQEFLQIGNYLKEHKLHVANVLDLSRTNPKLAPLLNWYGNGTAPVLNKRLGWDFVIEKPVEQNIGTLITGDRPEDASEVESIDFGEEYGFAPQDYRIQNRLPNLSEQEGDDRE